LASPLSFPPTLLFSFRFFLNPGRNINFFPFTVYFPLHCSLRESNSLEFYFPPCKAGREPTEFRAFRKFHCFFCLSEYFQRRLPLRNVFTTRKFFSFFHVQYFLNGQLPFLLNHPVFSLTAFSKQFTSPLFFSTWVDGCSISSDRTIQSSAFVRRPLLRCCCLFLAFGKSSFSSLESVYSFLPLP